ncbi:hypothetical protein BJY14_001072 [Actinomadura luteofluorescens]|uniref:Uncharacterized protein n=1 Tax=Actinomadura luteofluorescens TaxID=46163 RepID=A0A7Y9EC99_9ACTN|nr:hypothetical protein [Actinomadura luteofluorescens]
MNAKSCRRARERRCHARAGRRVIAGGRQSQNARIEQPDRTAPNSPDPPRPTDSAPLRRTGPLRRAFKNSSGTPSSFSAALSFRCWLLWHCCRVSLCLVRLGYGYLVQRGLVLQAFAFAALSPGFALPRPARYGYLVRRRLVLRTLALAAPLSGSARLVPHRHAHQLRQRPGQTCPGGTGASRCGVRWRRRRRRWRWGVRGVRVGRSGHGVVAAGLGAARALPDNAPMSIWPGGRRDLRPPSCSARGWTPGRVTRTSLPPTEPIPGTSRAGRVRAAWRRRRALPGGRVRGRGQSQHGLGDRVGASDDAVAGQGRAPSDPLPGRLGAVGLDGAQLSRRFARRLGATSL